MTVADSPIVSAEWTLADLLQQLGDIPPNRIRMVPPPGTATEEDVLKAEGHTGRVCELIDGVLVEKTVGYRESLLACAISAELRAFVGPRRLGIVLGADGTLKILPRQVRIPDVCFISWQRFPEGRLPDEPIPAVAPDLAVEVLSEGNTEGEMRRKLREYFSAGTCLVWHVDPRTRSAEVYTSPERSEVLGETGVLSGGDVLPGFALPLATLFAEVDQQAANTAAP
jgi:Uma2 family endonuclease